MTYLRISQPHVFFTYNLGFTLIEVLIVVSVSIILVLAATNLFFSTLIGGGQTDIISEVKNNGDYAMGQMESVIRNARRLQKNSSDQLCESNMNELVVVGSDKGVTTFLLKEDEEASESGVKKRIASSSATTDRYLTSGEVEVINGPTFHCTQTDDRGVTTVDISFTLQKGTPDVDKAREVVEQTFQTSVVMRRF